MRIKTKLRLGTLAAFMSALFTGVVLLVSVHRVDAELRRVEQIDSAERGLFDLNVLTGELINQHSVRVRQQWAAVHTGLGRLLEAYAPADPDEAHLLDTMQAHHVRAAVLFEKLSAVRVEGAASSQLTERVTGQVRIVLRAMTANAKQLSAAAYARITRQQKATALVALLVGAGMAGVVALVALWVHLGLVSPMAQLQEGISMVGAGNLGHAVGMKREDEFGDLGGAFDAMTARLRTTMASRDELAREVRERKKAELKLQSTLEDLRRSNQELEQFAYVASHDLQEPLRMVNSYVQLLQRRYQGQLDAEADKYIGFATDGASRMQTLINDLLSFSRVGSRGKPLRPTETQVVLDQVLQSLQLAIEEHHAQVTHDKLPVVNADAGQLGQVFLNLIGNGLKFSVSGHAPAVHVGVTDTGAYWQFSVTDNGIGIDPKYADRIFIIFQRLQKRSDYAGTGIGLAVCKKIVERHGGSIWLDKEHREGSRFCFTIPKYGAHHDENIRPAD